MLPLTGDASDRKYFRVLKRGGQSIVLALHADTFDPEALPFLRVAELFLSMPLPVPAILDRAPDLGILALEDLGDVTLQAHLGAAPSGEHRRLYREAVALIETLQRRGSRVGVAGVLALPDRVRCREADVGARLLHEAFPRGVSRRGDPRRGARCAG